MQLIKLVLNCFIVCVEVFQTENSGFEIIVQYGKNY